MHDGFVHSDGGFSSEENRQATSEDDEVRERICVGLEGRFNECEVGLRGNARGANELGRICSRNLAETEGRASRDMMKMVVVMKMMMMMMAS